MMFPRPTGNYARAIITGVVSLVLLIPQVIAVIRLFAGPGYPAGLRFLPPSVFAVLAFCQFTVVFAIVQFIRTEQDLRAAVRGEDRVAPPLLTQPDWFQAMRDGEQLTLERRMRTPVYWRDLGLLTLVVPLTAAALTYFGEAIVFLAAPHASGWILAWVFNRHGDVMYVPPPRLRPVEWGLVAIPIVLATAMCAYAIWEQLSSRRQVITSDDHGITVKWSGRRRAFIPWHDVQLLINARSGGYGRVAYWLRGERHGVILDLGSGVPAAGDGKPPRPVYDYVGGIDAYEAAVQRLLATIVVRAHVPLRTWAGGYYQRTRHSESIPLGLTSDEVAAMPVAGALLQPLPEAVAAATASTTSITLCANIPLRSLLRRATKYGAYFGVPVLLLYVFTGLAVAGGNFSRAFPGLAGLGGILLVAFMVGLFYSLGLLIAVQFSRNGNPAITADRTGLTAMGYNKTKLGTIGWAEIRAWGMVQPAPGAPAAVTYAVYTDSDTLIWTEPANAKLVWQHVTGDRRVAYRATAERLHATIAARTGLQLHLIVPRQ